MLKRLSLLTLIIMLIFSLGNLDAKKKSYKVGLLQLFPSQIFDMIFNEYAKGLKLSALKKRIKVTTVKYDCKGKVENVSKGVKKFERENVDLIFTLATPPILAVKKTGTTIPAVFVAVTFPVQNGVINSLKNPGGNITGVHMHVDEQRAIDTIKMMMPDIKSIGTIYNDKDTSPVLQVEYWEKVCKKNNIKYEAYPLRSSSDKELKKQMENQIVGKYDLFVMLADAGMAKVMKGIGTTAIKHKFPTFSTTVAGGVENQLLFGMGPNMVNMTRRCIPISLDILTGKRKASQIAVEGPNKYTILVNMKMAKKIGKKVPLAIIKKATKVIE